MRLSSFRRPPKGDGQNPGDEHRLPLRWAVILLAALGTGVLVGGLTGPAGGVVAAVAVATLFHAIL
ncbi:hypothetical protein [Nonomuraea sp. NPDC050783]|uniref:hypothetical protein n=1 Tax=Nonomuraea sp. NPDC050783 TaxID=3154634 RepID=UPI003467E0F7